MSDRPDFCEFLEPQTWRRWTIVVLYDVARTQTFATGVKKSDIWPRLSIAVAFDALQFRNGAIYWKSKKNIYLQRRLSSFLLTKIFRLSPSLILHK